MNKINSKWDNDIVNNLFLYLSVPPPAPPHPLHPQVNLLPQVFPKIRSSTEKIDLFLHNKDPNPEAEVEIGKPIVQDHNRKYTNTQNNDSIIKLSCTKYLKYYL